MESIGYGRQWITDDDIACVIEALKSPSLTQGRYIDDFEKNLAEYCGANYAVAVSSGTAALHIVYAALGLSEGDEIITTPNTFSATANAALYMNARPRFADIEISTGLINENLIENLINDRTKIIVPVHYGGLPCDMEKIKNIAVRHNIKVAEDACHAIGSGYKGFKTGCCKYSDAAIFSFHPVKHITTGEGGAILTNNKEIYDICLKLRSHGMERQNFLYEPDSPAYHEMQLLGYNYRMTDIQAALGISQLKRLDEFIKRRREIAALYIDAFKDCEEISCPTDTDNGFHSYHLFPILLRNRDIRDRVFFKLKENNIFPQIHYMPVNKQPYYRKSGYDYKDTPMAYEFYTRELSIPMYPKLEDKDAAFAADIIIKAVSGK